MNSKVKEILNQMTLEEKAGLCSGSDFWYLKSVERLGLSQIMVTDGPHGVRKQGGESDHVGLSNSMPATCFPTAVTTASSWDPELIFRMGQAIGEECLQENVSVLLGPGANIKRSPLCGRNFEYISEDPYHTGLMAAAMINGVQSKGIGTSLKHFVLNNQETRRLTIDSVADERAKREIYLAGFEKAVKEAQPWTVMCSYNKADGTYLSEHKRILTDILKDEWKHVGLTITDWGACNDRVKGIEAGLDLEMPSSWGKNDEKITIAVRDGRLSIELLDKAVYRIIELILKGQDNRQPGYKYNREEHHKLARKIAGQSSVLLKNDSILPISKKDKVAVIGKFARNPRYQGTGSSIINPTKKDNICMSLEDAGIEYEYAQGYNTKIDKVDLKLIAEAKSVAKKCKIVILAAGLTDIYESEGFDRRHLRMPDSQNELIKEITTVNPNIVIVLMNGSPVEMPWADDVQGILECYLGGQAGGGAVVDLLFGDINPSGKLAETFPLKTEDVPTYNYFPGFTKSVEYRESIFVGYRYYDKVQKNVRFPFGYGLSYTEFEYSDINVICTEGYNYKISVSIKNIGNVYGAEIVQLYVKNPDSKIFKADKELKGFEKVFLPAGESKTVTMLLNDRSFAFYNINIPGWHVEKGEYIIQVGASSRDIRLEQIVSVQPNSEMEVPDYKETAPGYYSISNNVFEISQEQFKAVYGNDLPQRENMIGEPFHQNSVFGDATKKLVGRLLLRLIKGQTKNMVGDSDGDDVESSKKMVDSMIREMPIRTIGMLGGDRLPKYFTEGFVAILNGKFFKGLGLILKRK